MFLIPGFIISILTFPGIIIHEISRRFFAEIAKVPVYDICYFRIGDPAGYVVHGSTNNLGALFLITIGPLIINTLLCIAITFSAIYATLILNCEVFNPIFIFLLWVGLSIGMHAFPSDQDSLIFLCAVEGYKGQNLLWLLSLVFAFIIKIANLLRFFWFDLIYAIGVSLIIPYLIMLK